ncbi:SMI1/KNR4 family protein [Streptomyces sp. NWU339]|uniref:SMI1/KNR4 family protein n=1 Tax=Streptomyces sp. NWU339 TaxID=2185284 RepID=UPI0011B6B496|nr:SMI1/KNR4 family protein [Streptomyces sp. NWU339]
MPATEGGLRSLEQDPGVTVPADVRAFYLVRNGTGPASDVDWPTSRDAPEPTGYFLPEGERDRPPGEPGSVVRGPGRGRAPGRRARAAVLADHHHRPGRLLRQLCRLHPGQGYGLLGDYAEAELLTPGQAAFAACLTAVADALCQGRGFGDDNAPRVIDGRLDWR